MEDDLAGQSPPEESGTTPRDPLGVLPVWAYGVAGLLALAPAVGFHLLIRSLAPRPVPAFIFFYWVGALYVAVRKVESLTQVYKRIGVLVVLEGIVYLAVRFFS
jgi:hypothetical protein